MNLMTFSVTKHRISSKFTNIMRGVFCLRLMSLFYGYKHVLQTFKVIANAVAILFWIQPFVLSNVFSEMECPSFFFLKWFLICETPYFSGDVSKFSWLSHCSV